MHFRIAPIVLIAGVILASVQEAHGASVGSCQAALSKASSTQAVPAGMKAHFAEVAYSPRKEVWAEFAAVGTEYFDNHKEILRGSQRESIGSLVVDRLMFGFFIEGLAGRAESNPSLSTVPMHNLIERLKSATNPVERRQLNYELNLEVNRWSEEVWLDVQEFFHLTARNDTRRGAGYTMIHSAFGWDEFELAKSQIKEILSQPVQLEYAVYLIGLSAFEIQDMIYRGHEVRKASKESGYYDNPFFYELRARRLKTDDVAPKSTGLTPKLKNLFRKNQPLVDFDAHARLVRARAQIDSSFVASSTLSETFKPRASSVALAVGNLDQNWVEARLRALEPTVASVEKVGFEIADDYLKITESLQADYESLISILKSSHRKKLSVASIATADVIRKDFSDLSDMAAQIEHQYAAFSETAASIGLRDSGDKRVNIAASQIILDKSAKDVQKLKHSFSEKFQDVLTAYGAQ